MTFLSLKEKLLAINKTIYFDHNDYLREKTTDPFKLKQVLAEAETYIEQASYFSPFYIYIYNAFSNICLTLFIVRFNILFISCLELRNNLCMVKLEKSAF